MILYVDTSAFVPLIVDESGTPTAVTLWTQADRVVSSRLLYVEAHAALAQARRMDRIGVDEVTAFRRALDVLHDALDVVECTDPLSRRAAQLAHEMALHSYDAVHCASAELVADPDLVVASGDRRLLDACARLGLATADTNGS